MHLKQTSFPLPEPSLHLYLVIKILKPNNVILEILHIPMYLPSIVNTLTYTFWHRTNPSLTHKNWDLQVRQIRLSHYLRKHSFFSVPMCLASMWRSNRAKPWWLLKRRRMQWARNRHNLNSPPAEELGRPKLIKVWFIRATSHHTPHKGRWLRFAFGDSLLRIGFKVQIHAYVKL